MRSLTHMHPPSARPSEEWQPGDRLTLRGENWTVASCTRYADCEALRVDADRNGRREIFLLPFDRPQPIPRGRVVIRSMRAWFHRFKRLLADACPYGGLRFCPDSIELLPYQLEAPVAMLRDGHPRVLIADDVGLGKTIEAGLILRELAMRQDAFRAIVLLPAGLRHQWSDELGTRFGLEPILADASWLRDAERSLPPDLNPWSLPGIYLASFDFVKRPEALRPLEDVFWDLVVVDEAHAATLSTDRRAAIDAIAVRAQRVVLLTATPPGDASEFAGLCRIGAVAGETDLPVFQRTQVGTVAEPRRSSVVAVRLSGDEQRMHRSLERYTTLMWAEGKGTGNPQARLVSTILRKRALSSAAALELSLRRRKDLLTGHAVLVQQQLLLPLQEEETLGEDAVPDSSLSAWMLGDRATEEHWLDETIAAASQAAAAESKARILKKLLRRAREPLIVFTEYRDSLARLQRLLQASGIHTCALHGGLSAAERRMALAEFRQGKTTLLATDAAAEGLNLQQSCRAVVHYELPWNPARMLQRTGRVDRIGQRRRVHEIALVAADTAESLVIAPLSRRLAAWDDDRRRGLLEWLTESRMAEAVFEGSAVPLEKPRARQRQRTSLNLQSDGASEAQRLEARRFLLRTSRTLSPVDAGLPCGIIRRCSLAPGIVLLFDLKVLHGRDIVDQSVVALYYRITLTPWAHKLSMIRERIREVLPTVLSMASPVAEGLARHRADAISAAVKLASDRASARAQSLQHARESAARHLVQVGLFERHRPRRTTILQTTRLLDDPPIQSAGRSGSDVNSSADLTALLLIPPR